MANFRLSDRVTSFLLPPSVDEWLPQRHLARFIVEVVEGLDLSAMSKNYRGTGSASYPIFNTPQNKPHLIRPLRRPGSPSGTTSTSCGGYTVSFLTPPGAASMAKAS
jgi:hypothetical protein